MITGYKATDSEIRCNGYQFVPGEWYEHEGPIEKCKSGFHFCRDKSGVFSYYNWPCRIWKVEAEEVENLPLETGTFAKYVCRRIRLVEEITAEFENQGNNSGNRNSGNWNSGNQNSGNWNSGNQNSGNQNSGDQNSGNWNSGNRNSRNGNSGHGNSGDQNSGDGNSGNRNSGNRNSGDGNSGDQNSGDGNSGNGNACDRSSGFFNTKEQKVISFDEQTNLTYKEYVNKYPVYETLTYLLQYRIKIDFDHFKMLPGITEEKLEKLHKKHLKKRGLL